MTNKTQTLIFALLSMHCSLTHSAEENNKPTLIVAKKFNAKSSRAKTELIKSTCDKIYNDRHNLKEALDAVEECFFKGYGQDLGSAMCKLPRWNEIYEYDHYERTAVLGLLKLTYVDKKLDPTGNHLHNLVRSTQELAEHFPHFPLDLCLLIINYAIEQPKPPLAVEKNN